MEMVMRRCWALFISTTKNKTREREKRDQERRGLIHHHHHHLLHSSVNDRRFWISFPFLPSESVTAINSIVSTILNIYVASQCYVSDLSRLCMLID
ncbi:hypothetical protein YC2023_045819 [Brassica napus]